MLKLSHKAVIRPVAKTWFHINDLSREFIGKSKYAFKYKIQKLMATSLRLSDQSISNWPLLAVKVMKQANYYCKDHCFNLQYFPTMSEHKIARRYSQKKTINN